MSKNSTLPISALVILFYLWFSTPITLAQEVVSLEPVFILFKANPNPMLSLVQTQNLIQASGGRVIHIFPGQAIIAKMPATAVSQLSTQPEISAVFTQPVELAAMDSYGPDARRLAGLWNDLIAPQATVSSIDLAPLDHLDEADHTFTAPDLPESNDLQLASAGSVTPGYYQTSEYMAGSVAVGVVLVESDGRIDPSTENWTGAEKQLVFSEIVAALNWWAELEPRANLSFVYDDHFSTPLPTRVEPITRPFQDQQYWISDAMSALGYNASSYFTSVRDYNNALRAIHQTDWAFTIFVVDSSNDPDHRFSDRLFAYAYLGGPFMVMTYGNNGYGPYNMDAVAAHEAGHIFLALDQYYNAAQPCTRRSGYLNIENQNSQYGGCASNVASIMRGQILPYTTDAVDPYAAGQIGWRDSDGDNILDPLDAALPITIETLSPQDNQVTVSGLAYITPYPSPSRMSVTINTLAQVQYRFDGGKWQLAQAGDGAFDSPEETYRFTTGSLSPGRRTLEIAAIDSAGNVSASYATASLSIFDPIDGGLNTELFSQNNAISGSATATISGVAYHLENRPIVQAEYRLDQGPWQPLAAEDGAFNSSYEPFRITLNPDLLTRGRHLVEARAIDANYNVEANFASQEVEIAELSSVFLPFVMSSR
jgi:hypothetical protein